MEITTERNKKLTEGTENQDAMTFRQMETGLQICLKTDGSNQMFCHIDMEEIILVNCGDPQGQKDAGNKAGICRR